MRITLFVNDSLFSYLLAKPIVEAYPEHLNVVVFSSRTKRSLPRIVQIFKKTYLRYFFYRVVVDFLSRLCGRTVASLVKKNRIKTVVMENVNDPDVRILFEADLAIIVNFDQILKGELLQTFQQGVINVHASRLPLDKGISPILWAFARGDQSVWCSIYQVDEGLDSGPLYDQFEVPIRHHDTSFSLYSRVCCEGSRRLVILVDTLIGARDPLPLKKQNPAVASNCWSWPNTQHRLMMKSSGRKFISFMDIIHFLKENLWQ